MGAGRPALSRVAPFAAGRALPQPRRGAPAAVPRFGRELGLSRFDSPRPLIAGRTPREEHVDRRSSGLIPLGNSRPKGLDPYRFGGVSPATARLFKRFKYG